MDKFTPEYIQNVQQIIKNDEKDKARELLKDLHPADIAELYQQLNLDEAEYIYMLLDGEKAADVLLELDEDDREKMLKQLPSEVIAKQFIDYMDSDDAHIDDVEQAGDIVDLLKYDEDTAGGLMGTEMVVVNENWSMPECVKQMRIQAEELGQLYYVYVVDDDDRLKGVFPLKKMITNPSASKIKHVMRKGPVSVKTDTPINDVAMTFEKYDLVAVPVIDSIGRLVGQITVDDIMDEVREQSEREYQLASGLSQDVESNDTVFTQTAARLPWLLIGMVGGLANSVILGNFESNIAKNPATALFIPLIGGTGGNVGIQSSAIVVQGLANGKLDLKTAGKQLFKELGVALINACMISLLVFVYNWFFLDNIATTVSVSLSLFAVVIFASIFGTLVPLTLERFKIDPAIATGPFITITNDIIGMLIYMSISYALSI